MSKKIRIAFIKFGGLSAGGTEKFLQNIAVNLPVDKFSVDYFYCNSAPYIGSDYTHADTDQNRKKYMEDHGVNLIKFDVKAKDINTYTHDWIGTNFWEFFDESKYDIIQTGRAGHPEYPFSKIKKTPIVDSIHTLGGVDNRYNISRVMHITKWSANQWIGMGGDKERIVYVSHPMEIQSHEGNIRDKLKLEGIFVLGFHQRDSDEIFSNIPLDAYKNIESEKTFFLIMGGSKLYSEQAEKLKLKNFKQLSHSAKPQDIYDFLQTLNVYAHGRKDGELNSTAMAEAMYFGLPIVSHSSSYANGHIECIGEGGRVLDKTEDYATELKKLMENREYYKFRSSEAKKRFGEMYELKNQISKIVDIYKDVIQNPFPNKFRRLYFDLVNRIKKMLYNRYTLLTYRKLKKILKK
jgi:glycosyltransferase involved in cell wall biosynthesis